MKRRSPPLSDADRALFRDAIGQVRPLPADERASSGRTKPAATPRSLERDEAEALAQLREAPLSVGDPNAGEPLSFRRPHLSERQFRRLRRGQFAVQDEIDLHHLTAAQAEPLLREFLRAARAGGASCVRIVHGKGLRSRATGPVLKGLVDRMLSRRQDVLAYASAPPAMGGTGAVLVLLSRARPGEQRLPDRDDADAPPGS